MIKSAPSLIHRFLLTLIALACLLVPATASAAGRVEWKSKTIKEREGGYWRLELAIYMPRAPDVAHVPMKFEFQPTAYYERSMVDGDKLLERTVPLEHRQSLIESVDVGFLDSGTGNIEKRTRFTFKVTRAHGYEAGEYKVTIRDTRNGQTVGTPTTLKFQGENEIIDRRSIVFTGKKEKKKPEQAKSEEAPAAGETASEGESAGEAMPSEGEGEAAEGDDEAMEDEGGMPADGPPPIEEKPGGCGCRVAGQGASQAGLGVALLGLALFAARRRALGSART
ncbi:MAG TPA: MYXO-CTERM sorting domain-containing protein [Polyangiaceae bacterium]|nr:MYXO-CTERM sorting domain-containing protein [Polyangiaceae bacterium]